ncbi:MAG TPA: hypothetical protein PK504_03495 [Ferruginibacter sp.]|nr:hypothetical protein [Ferruginibacter sp.]HRE65163.1 hypothetical protein [Ferruginibacter sp.]
MRNLLKLLIVVTIFSCNNNKEKSPAIVEEIVEDSIEIVEPKIIYNPETTLYIWHATGDYKKIKNPNLPDEGIKSADSLIRGLNEYYADVLLEKVKQSGDTIYTVIKDNNYLGNQMGSTGAEVYLADVILNLTSVPGIQYVRIDMDVANHIAPGTWSAKNFIKYKEAIK